MKRVVIESPFGSRADGLRATLADIEENVAYLRRCLLDSLRRGEAPFASHALYPQVLDDSMLIERGRGVLAGLAWGGQAELVAVYMDRGLTPGMSAALEYYATLEIPVERRWLAPLEPLEVRR